MKASYQGMKIPSDVLRMFGLLFKSNKTVESFQAAGLLHEASRYFDNKEYDQAAGLLKRCVEQYPDQMIAKINLSVALIKAIRLQDAKELLMTLNEENRDDQYDFLIYNNLAWVFLLENNEETLGEADRFSKMAFDLNPDLPPIKGTRAYALISQGTVDEGIKLLLKNIHLTEPIDSKADHPIWFCFLAYAYYLKGEKEKVEQYLQPIEDYQNWDPDEKYLYEVLKSKTENFKGIFQDKDQLKNRDT
jgi:predicted Zn-dependent protease